MSRPESIGRAGPSAGNIHVAVEDGLAQVVRTLAECDDVSEVMLILHRYLGCEVELLFAPAEGGAGRQGPDILRSGDSYWVSIPLLFDQTRLGWLRARVDQVNAAGMNVLALAGRIVSCLLWEQARAHRAWVALLNGGEVSRTELTAAVRECGFPDGATLLVLACLLSPCPARGAGGQDAARRNCEENWYKTWLGMERRTGPAPLCFVRGNRMAVLCQVDCQETSRGAMGFKAIAADLQRFFRQQHGGDCAIGIGGATSQVERLPRLWWDAVRALDLGAALGGPSAISNVESLGMMGLLMEHVPAPALSMTCRRLLGPLIEHDEQKGTDFCHTLRVFLDSDCRFAEAARLLFVHENTLRHRIKRIEEAMGLALSDPYARANLLLCLKLVDLSPEGNGGRAQPGLAIVQDP